MSNMSYCRFENTANDFADCLDALDNLYRGDGDALSDAEMLAAKRMTNDTIGFLELLADRAGMPLAQFVDRASCDPDLVDTTWDAVNAPAKR